MIVSSRERDCYVNQTGTVVKIAKPPVGITYNQCGVCCIEEVCELNKELGDADVCLALEAAGDRLL